MNVFFDTNVLIYRIDHRDPIKQDIARRLVWDAMVQGVATISTQSLQEFYNAATRRIGLHPDEARKVAEHYSQARIVQLKPPLIFAAMTRHAAGGFSFWDALIVEAALAGGASTLYSEDMQDGLQIGTLTIRNPFAVT
jgi:predicted nucleic acid-binding protein